MTTHSRILLIIILLAALLPGCKRAEGTPLTVPAGAQAGDLAGLEPCALLIRFVVRRARGRAPRSRKGGQAVS